MSVNDLVAYAHKHGIEAVMLDDFVKDCASDLAIAMNESGMEAQIRFLLETCYLTPEGIKKEMRTIIE